jgi:16S rRNA processing protein RimM
VSSSASGADSRRTVGELKRPHGLRGEIAVRPVGDFPGQIRPGATLAVVDPDGRTVAVVVSSVRPNGTHLLLKFAGRERIEDVQALSGCALAVDRSALSRPADDFLFDDEVEGFACVTPTGAPLGRAEAFERHGPSCLLRVERGGARYLVPYTHPIVREVSRERREIVIEPPVGLFEL